MSTTTTRKFPPPCWTRDEALVLIDAYRERWHALHRTFLKTPDWDMVAEKVKSAFPNVTPPKTPAQCRHKMEKLRQRHRAEKQRQTLFLGARFVSSWFFFDAMEAMEKNHDEPGSNNNNNNNNNNQEVINGIPLPGFNPLPGYQGLNPGSGIHCIPTRDVIINEAYETHKYSLCKTGTPVLIKTGVPSHARKFSKVIYNDDIDESDENSKMWIKVCRNNININPNVKQGKKRVNNGINEVVSSIKLLGEGFMRMEKMKIDMAREIEKMRMEMEMRRYQLILESQRQIVDAVVKGLVETRKQQRTGVMTD